MSTPPRPEDAEDQDRTRPLSAEHQPTEAHGPRSGPEATRIMPAIPPEESFSSAAHTPHHPPPETAAAPSGPPPSRAPATPASLPAPAPPQSGYGAGTYPAPQYAYPPQQQGQPEPAQRAVEQPRSPRRTSSGCFGVVLTLFLAVFATLGTIPLLAVWLQASMGFDWAGSVERTFSMLQNFPQLLTDVAANVPGLVAASVMCLVAALCLPSAAAALRGFGIFLLLAANVVYAGSLVYGLHQFSGRTAERWQALPELWPTVGVADVVLVPLFLLLSLLAIATSSPRKR